MATDSAKLLSKYDLIDFHSHILPGVDHGSSSLETSLFQLKSAKRFGINKVVASSHFYPNAHNVNRFVEKREIALKKVVSSGESIPEIKVAAEVLVCVGIENLPDIEKLFVQDTNILLLELPFIPSLHSDYYKSVERLIANGIDVVLAHADRYKPHIIDKMIDLGVRLQINASSLSRIFGCKRHILEWIDKNYVVALGSDIHGMDKKAYYKFINAVNKLGDRYDYINKESNKMWSSNMLEKTLR